MRALLRRAGLSISAEQKIEFPSGSMFWFRGKALAPLLDLGLGWADFSDCRPRNVDATIAHAVERSILIFAALAGYKWAYHPRGGRWRRWLRSSRAAARNANRAAPA
jgi:lipopolysaccharide biosynthesis protein